MELADRYRARATTVRKITDGILDEAVRAQLLIIADQYENLARDMEARATARGVRL
jgi:hypothetical protein